MSAPPATAANSHRLRVRFVQSVTRLPRPGASPRRAPQRRRSRGPDAPLRSGGRAQTRLTRHRFRAFHLFQKMKVPRLVPVMISGALSLFRSTTATCEPTPDRL